MDPYMENLSLRQALDQIRFAHRYTMRLLDAIDLADWFKQPGEGISHVAWQVGHLAMAAYRLGLDRVRGRKREDSALISDRFLNLFARESVPEPSSALYPPADEIRLTYERIHERVQEECPTVPAEMLEQPPTKPHPLFKTKLGGLVWCAQHEMLHAGQIGLLRRLIGYDPLW
jgi:hypothetical protein